MLRLSAVALALLGPLVAEAKDCPTPYDVDTLFDDLGTAEAGLKSGNYAQAIQTSTKMRDGLACLDSPLVVVIAPRVLRAIGAGLYIAGEEDAEKWLRGAAYAEPTFTYGDQDLPAEHPIRRAWVAAKAAATAAPVEQPGVVLAAGKHWVDGKPITTAATTPDAYHVYQTELGGKMHSWVIDGPTFPPEASGGGALVVAEPEPEPASTPEPVLPEPIDPVDPSARSGGGGRFVMLGVGGAALAGSGVLYGLSAGARSSFDQAQSVEDLDRYMAKTNTFVVASGVSAAAGASVLGLGALFFVIDGDPRPTLDLRF